jgi:Putative Flp pilus-assembly TadE/G-like
MVLVTVAMLALIAVAGLAIDTAHVLLNKSRLQSALDAAALAAAKVLDQTGGNTASATIAANSVFGLNVAAYPELQNAVSGGLSMTTQYSSTLIPFTAGTTPAKFVRAAITGFSTSMSLVSVLGFTSLNVAGSAVAGPSAPLQQVCNIVPILMCGSAAAGGPLYGYSVNQVLGLSQVPGNINSSTSLGPGNFNLLSIGGTGGSVVRTNFAGSYSACASVGNTVTTETGVAAGPVAQGVNTRFNQYGGGLSAVNYPPDVINNTAHQTSLTGTTALGIHQGSTLVTNASQISFNWANYNALELSGPYDTQPLPTGTGEFRRREVAVPIGDCSVQANGKTSLPVLGFACLFLLQPLPNSGQQNLYAQVTGGCDAAGRPSGASGANPGPHVIELYKSAGSPDS